MNVYLSICAIYRDEAPVPAPSGSSSTGSSASSASSSTTTSAGRPPRGARPLHRAGHRDAARLARRPRPGLGVQRLPERHRDDSRWIAFLDLDEFLFSPTGRPLPEVLADYESAPGVVVNWAMFGTSGHRHRAGRPGDRELPDDGEATYPKLHVQEHRRSRADVSRQDGVHRFAYSGGAAVDENLRPIPRPAKSATPSLSYSRLRINHYFQKSEEAFRRNARARELIRGHLDPS